MPSIADRSGNTKAIFPVRASRAVNAPLSSPKNHEPPGGRQHSSPCYGIADLRVLPHNLPALEIERPQKLLAGLTGNFAIAAAVKRLARAPTRRKTWCRSHTFPSPAGRTIRYPDCNEVDIQFVAPDTAGQTFTPSSSWLTTGRDLGPSISADSRCPSQLVYERCRPAIVARSVRSEHIKEAVAIALREQLARLALEFRRQSASAPEPSPSRADRAACIGNTTAACRCLRFKATTEQE